MSLPQMSFSGAVMILAIVALRAIALHRLPKNAFLALWSVAVSRLLVPYSIPSAFSFYSLLGQLAPAAEAGRGVAAAPYTSLTTEATLSATALPSDWQSAVSISPWAVLWMVGALVCAIFFATAYWRCRKEFQTSLPVDNGYVRRWLGKHRLSRVIEVRQCDKTSAPLTYGVLRPVILMPKTMDWEDLDTLEYALAHEYAHIRRFDVVTKLAVIAALCVHWFNPAVWMMYILANRDIELACDEAVLRQLGEKTKSAYAMALIRMEEGQSRLTPLCNNFSKNAIEERIVAIMKAKKFSLATLAAAVALVFGVTVAFATSFKDSGLPMSGGPGSASDTANSVAEGDAVAADFLPYAPYGLVWDDKEQALFWNGERVRYFLDGTDLDGTGAMAIRLEYADMSLEGDIDVRAVRQRVENPDGSFDPMGPLTGLEKFSRKDFEERVFLNPSLEAETYAEQNIAGQTVETKELLELYAPFGLTYEYETDSNNEIALRMSWQGKPVHSVYDPEKAVWIANSMRGLYLGPDAIDLEAVYQNDKLTGLRETRFEATTALSFVADVGDAEPGTTFAQLFEKYASFGITYIELEGASGTGNVYYNGQLVSRFVDLSPDGGAFTFSSWEPGVLVVKTLYDKNGELLGIGTIEK